jgi:hypothetical protein
VRPLVLIALVGALAGCAGDDNESLSKGEYLEAVREIEQRYGAEAGELYIELVLDDPLLRQDECTERAHEFHGLLEEIVSEVEDLRPPEEVRALQERFLAEARETVDTVGGLAAQVEEGELACGTPFNEKAYGLPSTDRAAQVLEKFKEQGYLFGSNSG